MICGQRIKGGQTALGRFMFAGAKSGCGIDTQRDQMIRLRPVILDGRRARVRRLRQHHGAQRHVLQVPELRELDGVQLRHNFMIGDEAGIH